MKGLGFFGWRAFALVGLIGLLLAGSTCRKERFTSDPTAMLEFSTDTVQFDTVFTSIGSATYNFKVRNPNNRSLKIEQIYLGGGESSPFRLNVDGKSGVSFSGKEISAGDSFYVFVEVTIDPASGALPFVIEDSVVFVTNGNLQRIPLVAWGQNARFFNGVYVARGDTTWREGLPIVIYNSAGVLPGTRLTIEEGVKVYSHRGSALIVEGELRVNGTLDNPVIFQGDRLEPAYSTAPGQWYGIFLDASSGGAMLTHTTILNATVGILADSMTSGGSDKLSLDRCIIGNMSAIGVFGQGSKVSCINSLIYNCIEACVVADEGGEMTLTHLTLDNTFTSGNRSTPSLILTNKDYADPITGATTPSDLTANIANCIIWGGQPDEATVVNNGRGALNVGFGYNLIRADKVSYVVTNIVNLNPEFIDGRGRNYQLDTLSPAMNKALPGLTNIDLLNEPRDAQPDIGCHERKE